MRLAGRPDFATQALTAETKRGNRVNGFFAAATFHGKTFSRQWQTTFGYLSQSRNPMDGVSNHNHQGAILTERPIFASIRILSTQFQTGLSLSTSDRGWV